MSETGEPDGAPWWLSTAVIVAFGVPLAAGLVFYVTDPASQTGGQLLRAGILTLMVTPAVRLVTAIADRARRADWAFVGMALVVVLELALVTWRAAARG